MRTERRAELRQAWANELIAARVSGMYFPTCSKHQPSDWEVAA